MTRLPTPRPEVTVDELGFPPLAQRTVSTVLAKGAEQHPDRLAVIDPADQLTYADLFDRTRRLAGALAELGVGRQDAVLLMLDNHIDHALSWFALGALAAIEVPINTALRGAQLGFIIEHSEARVLIIEAQYLDRLGDLGAAVEGLDHVVVRGDVPSDADLPGRVHHLEELQDHEPGDVTPAHPWDISGIMYTSGTTGRSKGVLVTQAQTWGRMWPLGPGSAQAGDVTLVTLPLYHVIGQCRGLYNTLIAGGTAVIAPRFSVSRFWDSCRRYGVTYVPLVGLMAGYLLSQPRSDRDRDHPVQRMSLGTTIPEVREFADRFGVDVDSSYGLTEAGGVLVGPAEPKGCGWLRPDFEGRLVDDHDQEVATGEVGELVLRPSEPWTVMAGYHRRSDATVEKWRNLWLHTGDLMYQRPDGMHIFVDRKTESLRRMGENISTMEVEEALTAHPAVGEAAVVGIRPNPDDEQEIKAVVVPSEGTEIDLEDLVQTLATSLPYFAVPRFFSVVQTLPRTESTRRVQKSALRESGTEGCWDRVASGLRVGREGLARETPAN